MSSNLNNVLKRIKILEEKSPSDLVVYVTTKDGKVDERRVKDIITDDGELVDDISRIGVDGEACRLVAHGANLRDVDRLLDYIFRDSDIE